MNRFPFSRTFPTCFLNDRSIAPCSRGFVQDEELGLKVTISSGGLKDQMPERSVAMKNSVVSKWPQIGAPFRLSMRSRAAAAAATLAPTCRQIHRNWTSSRHRVPSMTLTFDLPECLPKYWLASTSRSGTDKISYRHWKQHITMNQTINAGINYLRIILKMYNTTWGSIRRNFPILMFHALFSNLALLYEESWRTTVQLTLARFGLPVLGEVRCLGPQRSQILCIYGNAPVQFRTQSFHPLLSIFSPPSPTLPRKYF